jgi:hypothetical protein
VAIGVWEGVPVGDSLSISPKVNAAAVGAALSTVVWTLLVTLFDPIRERLGEGALAALTGSTATIFAWLLGYLVRDPARG